MKQAKRGFTLIELLIVIGIIGFLAAAILVAVDPVKRIGQARDARRFAEVNGILNAILTKQVDDKQTFIGAGTGTTNVNTLPAAGNSNAYVIQGSGATALIAGQCAAYTCTGGATPSGLTIPATLCSVDISGVGSGEPAGSLAVVSSYITSIPMDPRGTSATIGGMAVSASNTGYMINRNTAGRITVFACAPDDTATNPIISVSR